MISKSHHYFLLNFNPWPLMVSLNSFNIFFSFLLLMKYSLHSIFLFNCFVMTFCSMIWWLTYSGEFNLEGKNSFNLDTGLKFSMLLFISSEVFFFFSFFWSYFHFFLSPTLEIGCSWPASLTESFDYLNVPLINTLILLSSGISVTISHYYLIEGKIKRSNFFLIMTVSLGILFSILQLMEYNSSFFSISDSCFGTSFFLLTGFHGLHVLIGTIFLLVTLVRSFKFSSAKNDWLSFELSSWYWHFVDVVWIFLYFMLYYMNM